MQNEFSISNKHIGLRKPCFIIAEVAQSHDGSLGLAHSFIDAVAKSGADAIKFQTHIASEESTSREPWRIKFSHRNETRFEYWKRMEFTPEEWMGLKKHCDEKKLIFMSSPFSTKAVDLLEKLEISSYKIGSGEIDNEILLNTILATKKPVILSTGMSPYQEIDQTYNRLSSLRYPHALLHCTSEYPVKDHHVGLNVIEEFLSRYHCPIGFSSHVPDVGVNFSAVVKGAQILEMHVAFSRDMFGPDVSSSLTVGELTILTGMIRRYENIIAHPTSKDSMAAELAGTKKIFRKSIVAARNLPTGHVIELADLAFKKPGDGLVVSEYQKLLGKKLYRSIAEDEVITFEDLK